MCFGRPCCAGRACTRVASFKPSVLGDFDAAGEACIVGDFKFDAADKACTRACARVASILLGDFDAAGEACIVGDFDAADKACTRACARVASMLLGDFDAAGEACIVGDFDAADRACGLWLDPGLTGDGTDGFRPLLASRTSSIQPSELLPAGLCVRDLICSRVRPETPSRLSLEGRDPAFHDRRVVLKCTRSIRAH
jgi:hypothetical protein